MIVNFRLASGVKNGYFYRLTTVIFVFFFLVGCSTVSENSHSNYISQPKEPDQQLPDYFYTDCADIWSVSSSQTLQNPLYWLRAMECARRLLPVQARREARQWSDQTWQDTFKRGILLSNAKITPLERRRYITQLDTMVGEVPPKIRSLFQVWRESQLLLLSLSTQRSRYNKLQQTSDQQLASLLEQQQRLRSQLDLMTRKLDNLSDIERQLSSRKPASNDISEDDRGSDKKTQQGAKP